MLCDWDDLCRELDCWSAAQRMATLWWRDDDAVEPSEALDRMIALVEECQVPLTLAVIPAHMTASLVERLAPFEQQITMVQHGYAHFNHAPVTEKKVELGDHRPLAVVLDELMRGWSRLRELAGSRALPILVPPWNRIAARLLPELPNRGWGGLSTYGPRPCSTDVPRLCQVNTHVDIMRWQKPRGFLGKEKSLGQLVTHLRDRREGRVPENEPTGLLTHHLVHDRTTWRFLQYLLPKLSEHPATQWLTTTQAFPSAAGRSD